MRLKLRSHVMCFLTLGETRRVLNSLTASVCPRSAAVDKAPWPNTAPVKGTRRSPLDRVIVSCQPMKSPNKPITPSLRNQAPPTLWVIQSLLPQLQWFPVPEHTPVRPLGCAAVSACDGSSAVHLRTGPGVACEAAVPVTPGHGAFPHQQGHPGRVVRLVGVLPHAP